MTQAVPLSGELLETMRAAAKKAIELREPFVTPRAILLALLEAPQTGAALSAVVNREKVLAATGEADFGVTRLPDRSGEGEAEAMPRYDTLAFKTPDGVSSIWLSRDAYAVFLEGARRAEKRYEPKHLAFGLAAQAVLAPGVLAAVRVEPGVFADAAYRI